MIERDGQAAFEGTTTVAAMARPFDDLIAWLGRETSFPHGAVLLDRHRHRPARRLHAGRTATSCASTIAGIGELLNPVATR